jgi:serine/threonine protein kinase
MELKEKLSEQIIEQLYTQKKSYNNFIYLGKGGTSVVYKYESHAIKIILKEKFNESEYKLSEYFNELLDKQISINFLRVYNLFDFGNYKVIEMELADGDLYKWINQKNSDNEWIKMILQLIISIRILQLKINFFHRDLKPKNILFKKLNNKINFTYKINNKEYQIEMNTIFYLTDFTHSESNITEKNSKYQYINIDTDLYELENLPKRLKVDKLMNKYDIKEIIKIGDKSRLSENFKSYFDKEQSNLIFLKSYPEFIKQKYLKRALIYYLVENKLIDYNLDVISDKISIILSELTLLDLDEKIDQIYNNLISDLK